MKKKQVVWVLALVVTICSAICLVTTVCQIWTAARTGGDISVTMVLLALITLLCAVMIWKGVLEK